MTTWVSSVPATLNALVAAFTAAVDTSVTAVGDGPVVTGSGKTEAIFVGFEDDAGQLPAVELESPQAYVANPSQERFTVNCLIRTRANTLTEARARAYALLADVITALNADPTLGGVVMGARIDSHHLTQQAAPKGVGVGVGFAIACDAWTRSTT